MLRRIGCALRLSVVLGVALACGRAPSKAPGGEASPVSMETALERKVVKAGMPSHLVARIGLATDRRTRQARPPVNLALLVDTSGSMEGRAIEDARTASLALLGSLSKEDRVSVVVFHSRAEVLLPSTRMADTDMKELRARIGAMKAQGTTDMGQGLRLALTEVENQLVHDGVNRIVMLGDGVPNDDRTVNGLVNEAASRGISITTLGLGNDYDAILMGRIAQESGGKFSYVEDSTKVGSFFAEEVTRLHEVVARQAYLELQPGPGIAVKQVVGRPASVTGRSMVVPLGDLSLGEEHEIVVELDAGPAKDGATVEVLDAVLHWRDAAGGAEHEDRVFLGAKATGDAARLDAEKDDAKVKDAYARATDAAATLKKLDEDRSQQRKDQANMPAPSIAAPRAPGPAAAAPTPKTALPAEEVRRQHARALRNFQANQAQ